MQYGYFDNEHKEYVINKMNLPTSWTNYLGVENMCAVVNHTAGGYVFYKSPEHHRITRFRGNGVPMDRPGFYAYLRDSADGDYWSISWQPVAKDLDKARYETRHGLSYSIYSCDYKGIHASEKVSIPMGQDAMVWDVNVRNDSDIKRELDLFTYAELSFHEISIDNQNFQMSLYCAGTSYKDGIILSDLFYEEDGYEFFTSNTKVDGYDTVRDSFLGSYRTESNPLAVEKGACSSSEELGNNHCASLQKKISLAPGESIRILFFLGEGREKEALAIREKYADSAELDKEYDRLADFWAQKAAAFYAKTPDEGMNTMIDIWTLYQAEINVMFSRFASFIEVGGRTGLGYRDTAQDAMTVISSDPATCKMRIKQLLRALTSTGYGIHLFEPAWFDPDINEEEDDFDSPTVIPGEKVTSHVHGLEHACADDALWLVPSVLEYVRETGDMVFLNEKIGYADGGEGTVYEHLKMIIDFAASHIGSHGVCQGLRADWNDCLNLGGGESTLCTFLEYNARVQFAEVANYLASKNTGEAREVYKKDADEMNAALEKLSKLTNDTLWDGDWFLRGYTKSGRKIGTSTDEEGRIHLESNAWAVLSGAADEDKARKALDSVHEHLATPYGIMLNTPAYTKRNDEIGFITRVYPGLKENSSVFSHPNPWVWAAECRLGNGDRAFEYYKSLTPYYQNDKIEIREAEPYSYCQFISGKDHTTYGRAHHPFMTGSGGWAYFAATHYMLGIRPDYDKLIIDPCIPSSWDGFEVSRIFRGTRYDIKVVNESHVSKGVKKLMLDGAQVSSIPAETSGKAHQVTVIM
ncbi:GH36-type glycosyl hydrolase domain-containing protein [Butyrivibrio sp. MC2013]|uniref:GH36-type glycosyl hydrolase domain-containing protein n=1 Tax=Butyrivibrio sp. MC2013 TaxID=1280686 RepID=UPI0004211C3C|nr:glycosyl hydrolase family 65 protein [Butyrivibrio sp. MC2013]